MTSYSSLESFYAGGRAWPGPGRRASRKVDYGVSWLGLAPRGLRPPPWRATYLFETQELIVTPLSGDGPVHVLAVLPRAELERRLAGWDDPELTGWQLGWLRNRLAGAAATCAQHANKGPPACGDTGKVKGRADLQRGPSAGKDYRRPTG